MAADDPRSSNEELQFDRVAGTPASSPVVTCVVCKTPVTTDYFHINGKTTCEGCKNRVVAATSVPKGAGTMGKALGLGLIAAIGGAALYYAVFKLTGWELSIVAIVIGYMVAWGVRKGSQGKGGRRFQVLAVTLTYLAIGLAYAPIALEGGLGHKEKSPTKVVGAVTDSARAGGAAPNDTIVFTVGPSNSFATKGIPAALLSFVMLFVFIFALPVVVVASSMPAGILSAIIILIGLRQAWHLTAAPVYKISGPYRVGSGPATVSP